jgi:hypothetical protein
MRKKMKLIEENGFVMNSEEINDNATTASDNEEENLEREDSDLFDIKEMDILKYKHEQEIQDLKKEYETQVEAMNNKLKNVEEELLKNLKTKQKAVAKKGKGKGKGKGKKKDEEANEEKIEENQEEIEAEKERQQLKMLEDMESGTANEEIDLTAEEWVNAQPADIIKKYEVVRRYATFKIDRLKKDYVALETLDKEKIDKLKSQYLEHKKFWETEKLVLLNIKDMEFRWDQEKTEFLDQAERAYRLQLDAQNTAESAIRQLEEYISEDAKIDRENAENTIHIIRERTKTLNSITGEHKSRVTTPQAANLTDEEKLQDGSQIVSKTTGDKREQIELIVDNKSLKFPDRETLQKIVDYINMGSTDRYSLILNKNLILSRSNTRVSSSDESRKRSIENRSNSGKKSSMSGRSSAQSDLENDNEHENANVDQVISKVLTEDDVMIHELRNTIKSRSSLRTKHMTQLEENKAHLNKIKAEANSQHSKSFKHDSMDEEKPHLSEHKTSSRNESRSSNNRLQQRGSSRR